MLSLADIPAFTEKMIGDFSDAALRKHLEEIEQRARLREEQARALLQWAAKLRKEIERRAETRKDDGA